MRHFRHRRKEEEEEAFLHKEEEEEEALHPEEEEKGWKRYFPLRKRYSSRNMIYLRLLCLNKFPPLEIS